MMPAMMNVHWPMILGIGAGVILAVEAVASLTGHGVICGMVASRTYHYIEIVPGVLYRDGMRNTPQFLRSCRRAGIQTVVSVVAHEEVASERFSPTIEECKKLGIATECLGVKLGGWPTTEAIRTFLDIAADPQRQPVLIHCREGVRRTGMIVAAYQMTVLGYTRQQAKSAMEQFGHSRRTVADVERFIELYDPLSRSVMYDADAQPAGLE